MKFNTPYGPAEGNLEGMEIKVSQGGGTGYENHFVPEVPTRLLGREVEMDLESFTKVIQEGTKEIIQAYQKVQLQMITEILRQLLKRNPEEEDFKKVSRVFGPNKSPGSEKYTLLYENVTLGVVETHYMPDEKQRLIFYPDKNFK